MVSTEPLASSFSGARPGPDAGSGAPEALEAALQSFSQRGRAAWPGVALDEAMLAAYLGARAPADAEPVAWLGGLPAGDLFLACACAAGLAPALRAFDAAFLDKIDVYLRALRPTPELVAETKQELLEKLFVGVSGRPAKILQYAGQGALGGWVRVSAVRTALNLLEAEKASQPRADEAGEIARAMVPDSDPELELIRASCKDDFAAAFREAMASLSRRDRSMLRFAFVERVTPARIGAIYGVHRTTAMRWIDAAQEEVLARTRARMMDRLALSPSECDRVFALVKSRVDISLGALLERDPMSVSARQRTACLDDDQLFLLLEGKLGDDARAEIEAHLDGCEACRRLVAAAAPADDAADSGERLLGRGASIGRYLVLSMLGRGGMGKVYTAYDPELDRRVALKLLHTARGSEGARRLLVREARALGKLSHPNVVQVHDVGEHQGDVFVAMELVEGQSLDAWCLGPPRPGFREVLAAYLDAARGLGAAHEKGLVHRDVKPSNILRGDDGRVRVADFGLAAGRAAEVLPASGPARRTPAGGSDAPEETPPLSETMPAPAGVAGSLDERLTTTGALLGTPLYMAPEQHEGSRVTAASDRYSLCVALYQGLYGAPPFGLERSATTFARLLAAKREGAPASPPPGAPVPAWVHTALARGLAPAPEDRYPSMDALIAALSDDPDARRRARRRNAGLGVIAAGLLALAAAGWAGTGARSDPCAHPEPQLSGAWSAGIRDRVRDALLSGGRQHAEATATRVLGRLDAYAAEWSAMRGEVCRASRGAAPGDEILGLRDACLNRRRGQLQALTTLLAERPDPEVLDKAVQMSADLYPIAYCADTRALAARVRPPEDPALRARVEALQPRADRLEALHRAGKYKDGLALGEPLLSETAALPYPPLRAQVQVWVGRLRGASGDYEGERALLRDAAVSAAEGRDDLLAAHAWAGMLAVAIRQRRFDEASTILALGPTAMVRVDDARALAMWASAEGGALFRVGKLAEAKVAHERALALRRKALGPDDPDVASSLNNVGTVLCAMNDCAAGRVALEQAAALSEKALGPDHPETAISLGNLGNALHRLGEYTPCLAVQERTLAIKEKALGPDHPGVALTLNNLGNVLYDLGDYPRALIMLQRALPIKERALGPDHPETAGALTSLGRILVRLDRLEEARPLLERALAAREKREGPAHAEVAEALLGLGELHVARRAPAEAVPVLERAISLANPEYTPELQLTLAEALWQLGRDRPRARALAETARATYEHGAHRPGQARAARWLADHAG